MRKSPFKPGDVVHWGRYGKYGGNAAPHGGWPDTVLIVKNEGKAVREEEIITISTLDGSFVDGGYGWTWFEDKDGKLTVDPFLTAVHKRRHP